MKFLRTLKNPHWIWIFIFGVCFLFWNSSLSFFPIPWPDDPAYFLPAIEWVQWPPVYRAMVQAAFDPTYAEVNFNLMPGLVLLFGIGSHLGIQDAHTIRMYGMIAFAIWVGLLSVWARRRGVSSSVLWLICLGALFSPVVRWGAMPIRSEIWSGLIWLLILMHRDFDVRKGEERTWKLSGLLALGAYIHFQAVLWVLPVAVSLFPWELPSSASHRLKLQIWCQRLWEVTWKTLLLLSPWLMYVFLHFEHFVQHFHTHLSRLTSADLYIDDIKSFFHYIFGEMGNPLAYPKFYNPGKGITWILILAVLVQSLRMSYENSSLRTVYLPAALGLCASFFIMFEKPERWFVTLVHLSFWPLIVLCAPRRIISLPGLALIVLLVLEIGVAVHHWVRARESYTWDRYRTWVTCIDDQIGNRKHVWQPTQLDTLVDLVSRSPAREYTRHNDVRGSEHLVKDYVHQTADAIVHTLSFSPEVSFSRTSYLGPVREFDEYYLKEYPWLTARHYHALYLGPEWSMSICHEGPFWAAISLRATR